MVLTDKRLNAEVPGRFLKFDGKPSNFETAADFFTLAGVRVIRDSDLAVDLVEPQEEMAPHQAVSHRIPLLALIRPVLTEPLTDAIERMANAIASTIFVRCKGCTFSTADERFDLVDEAWRAAGRLYYRGDWNSPLTRYSLMGPLCELLGLNGLERDVELLLSLRRRWS
ncbi:hypothetical protein [Nannocystis pusilla]|uniref:hypothetical protein n=1 Tax=Nannocystis pusilla TaxID=889268 RepID=UPI003B817AA0